MAEYVKLKAAALRGQRMYADDWMRYAELARGDECPEGYLPVAKGEKPAVGAGERLGWTYAVRDGVAYKEYFVSRPTPAYDKYELVMAIERAGLLEDFVALIRSDPVLELKWNAADYLDFSDGTLQSAIDAVKDSLGVTDEQVEAILAQAEVTR